MGRSCYSLVYSGKFCLPGFGFSWLSLGWFDCLQLVGWLFVWWAACLRVGLRIWAVVCGVGWCGLST